MLGMMKKDDRVEYVDKQVWIVLMQDDEGQVQCVSGYMDSDKAQEHAQRLKKEGCYAWFRNVDIEG